MLLMAPMFSQDPRVVLIVLPSMLTSLFPFFVVIFESYIIQPSTGPYIHMSFLQLHAWAMGHFMQKICFVAKSSYATLNNPRRQLERHNHFRPLNTGIHIYHQCDIFLNMAMGHFDKLLHYATLTNHMHKENGGNHAREGKKGLFNTRAQ